MPQFRVFLESVENWSVLVEAESLNEAEQKAIDNDRLPPESEPHLTLEAIDSELVEG
jgi:hypothetical protein